ncbi:MAG: TerC/Alx family metal homeostasis membrane protein [Prolixibacteraceae bacterium]|jgi:tellurite resistance protein TerC|nr:TerC/Alx family metal homeostasis membrane protein [Prolixibacteraceae bacterium]
MSTEVILMGGFLLLIVVVLMIDLLVVGRHSHIVSTKEALGWTSVWFMLSMGFYVFLKFYGHMLHGIETPAELTEVVAKYAPGIKFSMTDFEGMLGEYREHMSMSYLAGYFIEQTLSIDNVFVILLILQGYAVPQKNYKTVLFWGVLGAIILRFIFIFAGAALIQRFAWILYVFGAFLVFQGIKILIKKNGDEKDPHDSAIVKFLSKYLNITKEYHGDRFALNYHGKIFFTPLMLVLVMVEFTDVIFALDSIPAVFSVSLDPFVVFFSNIFAIIGLRSLFFLLANMVDKFRFLNVGVSILLIFVGLKLLAHHWLDDIGFKSSYSLYFIAATLILSVVFSALFPEKEKAKH